MIVNRRHFLIFLAVAVGVESFTNTFVTPRSISFQTKKVFEPKQVFVLNGLENESIDTDSPTDVVADVANEESSDNSDEAKKENARPVEDITKIAYVVNLSYGA